MTQNSPQNPHPSSRNRRSAFIGLAVATSLLAWQQWIIRDRSRAHCFAAFRNNNWVGLALWVGLVLALAIR